MRISNFILGERKVFVIAEIGNNHNGSVELALEMVDAAHEAGANCVKMYPAFTGLGTPLNRSKRAETLIV